MLLARRQYEKSRFRKIEPSYSQAVVTEQLFQCTEDSYCTLIEISKPMEFSEKDYLFKNYLKNARDGSKSRRKAQQYNFSTDLTL